MKQTVGPPTICIALTSPAAGLSGAALGRAARPGRTGPCGAQPSPRAGGSRAAGRRLRWEEEEAAGNGGDGDEEAEAGQPLTYRTVVLIW